MNNKDIGGRVAVLDLWDYYAAAALTAVINGVMQANWTRTKDGSPLTEATIAEQSALFADAMLAERAKRKEADDET